MQDSTCGWYGFAREAWLETGVLRGHLGGKAGAFPGALGDAALYDARLGHEHIHEVAPRHEVEQEVEVKLVLEAGVLAQAEGVRRVARDGLLAEHVLRALHHCALAHALHRILPPRRLLCAHACTPLAPYPGYGAEVSGMHACDCEHRGTACMHP